MTDDRKDPKTNRRAAVLRIRELREIRRSGTPEQVQAAYDETVALKRLHKIGHRKLGVRLTAGGHAKLNAALAGRTPQQRAAALQAKAARLRAQADALDAKAANQSKG